MEKLYQKINVPNFENMVNEIVSHSQQQIAENIRAWDIDVSDVKKYMPILYSYLLENFYRLPALFRVYNTPPFGDLPPHFDNNSISFNLPLMGTTNTQMNYYSNPSDNIELRYEGFRVPRELTKFPKDLSKIVLLESLELDKPALLRIDVLHSVTNNNPTYRLVLGMKLLGKTFEQVYKGPL